MLGPGFATGALRPGTLVAAYKDATLTVSRGEPAPAEVHAGPAGLSRALADLVRPLRDMDGIRVEFQIFQTEVSEDKASASIYFHAAGRDGEGALQQNAVWHTRWKRPGGDALPLLERIDVDRYEEVRIQAPGGRMFSDATEAVLGGNASFREQVLYGVDHWLERLESWIESDGFGHNGIAIGDVNGDGLDDLYLCQMGGLPNLLYVQNPDGTATDVSAEAGVDWLERTRSALFIDLDNDGDEDLVVATSVALLFMANDGAGHFTIRSSLSVQEGVATVAEKDAAAAVGPPSGEVQGGHYSRAGDLGTADPSDLVMMSSADYDGDGFLDVYACVYHAASRDADRFPIPVPYHDANNGGSNILIRNNGDWTFADVTKATGLDANSHRFSFAATWEDFDNDGDQDLYVANDFGRNNLYRNDGGRFTDVAAAAGVEDIGAGMSVDWGDYDHDGWMDLFTGNMFSAAGSRLASQSEFMSRTNAMTRMQYRRHAKGNSLFRNKGDGSFDDVSEEAGITRGRWAWDSKLVDLDNDSYDDALISNGYFTRSDPFDLYSFFWRQVVAKSPPGPAPASEIKDYGAAWNALGRLIRIGKSFNGRERNVAFLNTHTTRFADISAVSGLDFLDDARAAAIVDWDQDGDLDAWFVNRTGPRLRFVRNDSPWAGRSVAFLLQGRTCNRDAIGARLELFVHGDDGRRHIRTLHAGDGYLSQSSKWVHFGLGEADRIDRLTVTWPDGKREDLTGLAVGGRYRVVQGSGVAEPAGIARQVSLEATDLPVTPPMPEARIFLSAPAPAPSLDYIGFDGHPVPAGRPGAVTLVTLWASGCPECEAQLEEFTRGEAELKKARFRVLALSADGLDTEGDRDFSAARDTVRRIGFPFEAGMATAALVDKLDLLQRKVLWNPPPIPAPTTVVVDGDDLVAGMYKGKVTVEELMRDLPGLRIAGDKRLKLALPFAGRRQTRGSPDFFDYMDGVVRTYVDNGYTDEGARYYGKVVRIQPGRIDAHFNLGTILAGQGDVDGAIAEYRKVLELQPGHVAALNNLGYALAGKGQLDEAIGHYREALGIEPNNVSTLDNLGAALAAKGDLDQAIAQYRKALEIDPGNTPAMNNMAVALARQGKDIEAIDAYHRLLAVEPGNVPARINLGIALMRQGRAQEAIASLSEAAQDDPGFPEARYYLGLTLLRSGSASRAVSELSEAVRLRPDYSQAQYYLAIALAKTGDVDGAARLFAAALRLPEGSPEAAERLAWVLATHPDASLRDGGQAVTIASKVCELSGDSRVTGLDALAAAYAETGRYAEAAETARRAVELARSQGHADRTGPIQDRLRLYEAGRPYRDAPGGS